MKLPIKIIATLVILSLIGVFGYQTYWLTGLYHTMKERMVKDIHESMQMGDYSEMMFRIDSLSRYSELHGMIEASAGAVNDTVAAENGGQIYMKSNASAQDSVGNSMENEQEAMLTADNPFSAQIKKTNDLLLLSQYFQRGIHSGLDDFTDMNVQRYDSLLTAILADKGIVAPHRSEILHCTNRYRNDSLLHDTVLIATVTNVPSYRPGPKAIHFDYIFDIHGSSIHRLWMEPIEILVLKQMTGILITSLLILIILSFSFGYLIHILFRQKTLEEMKEDFTHNMTHELKTPIAVAYAANDAMLNFEINDKEKRRKYQYVIQEQLKQLGGLVEQILSMSMEQKRNFKLHKESIHIKELLDELIEQHKLKADKPVTFHTDIQPEDLTVNADRTHLYNIISNLIDNGVKYSDDSAHISIRAEQNDEYTLLSVTDKGNGIPSDKLAHIFDKFYRIPTGNRHAVKGYGLGLYYVKTMVEQHKGRISVNSITGQGSTFTILLPL